MLPMADNRLYVDFGVWGTIRKVALSLVAVAVLGGLALWYVPVLKQAAALQKEIEIKRAALKKQQALHQRYSDEINALRTDPEAVERAIREILGYGKPGETRYHFEKDTDHK